MIDDLKGGGRKKNSSRERQVAEKPVRTLQRQKTFG